MLSKFKHIRIIWILSISNINAGTDYIWYLEKVNDDLLALHQLIQPIAPANMRECIICTETKPISFFITLHCGHTFCITCLQAIFDLAIKEKNTTLLRCSNPDCLQPFSAADINKIVKDSDTLTALREVQLQE